MKLESSWPIKESQFIKNHHPSGKSEQISSRKMREKECVCLPKELPIGLDLAENV